MASGAARADDSGYWCEVFARAATEIVTKSWDVTGFTRHGQLDWTAEDVFLLERRTMPQVDIPPEEQPSQ